MATILPLTMAARITIGNTQETDNDHDTSTTTLILSSSTTGINEYLNVDDLESSKHSILNNNSNNRDDKDNTNDNDNDTNDVNIERQSNILWDHLYFM